MVKYSAKKTILLLSIISLHGSTLGMLESLQKKMSTFVLSQKKQVAAAVLIPLTAAGCVIAARHTEDISSVLENIPMPSEKILFGLATAAAMPVTYVLAEKFSPEEQFKACCHNDAEINNHLILKNKKKLTPFIEGEKTVQFNETEKPITLVEFITNNFSDEVDRDLYPMTKAANQLCGLERSINTECQRLQQIGDAGTWWISVKKEENTSPTITVSEQSDLLNEKASFIQRFRGLITKSPEYKEEQKLQSAIKKNQLTQEQITFSSKIAAFVPMFTQPVSVMCMVFLGMLFAKFGINIE